MTDAIALQAAPNALFRYFQVVVQPRTWLAVLWHLLGLPIGVAAFTFVVTGFSLGLGLAVTIVGIPLLVGMLFAVRASAALEGRLATAMLDADVPAATFASVADRPGFWAKVSANFRDSLTWRGLLHALLRLPLGVATFTIAVTLLAVIAALLAAPLTYDGVAIELLVLRADTFAEALACFVTGLLLAPAFLHALVGLGHVMGWMSRGLLAPSRARP